LFQRLIVLLAHTLRSYSIAQSVLDLETVVSELVSTKAFHLLGHSYGGGLAYDFASNRVMSYRNESPTPICQSMILSTAAFSLGIAGTEYDRLYKNNPIAFWNEHACRVGTPPPLQDALRHLGSVWGGMDVVADYVAQPIANKEAIPPTLVISGSYDFGYKASNEEAWKPLIPNVVSVNLENCAHYPFYEDGPTYGRVIEDFLKTVEGK
jgi:pimeloyl-ACP methyl ester carboxylesterase